MDPQPDRDLAIFDVQKKDVQDNLVEIVQILRGSLNPKKRAHLSELALNACAVLDNMDGLEMPKCPICALQLVTLPGCKGTIVFPETYNEYRAVKAVLCENHEYLDFRNMAITYNQPPKGVRGPGVKP